MDAIQIKDSAYIEALNRWRLVFTNLQEKVNQATSSTELLKKRILDLISSAIADGSVNAEEIQGMLKSLLKVTEQNDSIG